MESQLMQIQDNIDEIDIVEALMQTQMLNDLILGPFLWN